VIEIKKELMKEQERFQRLYYELPEVVQSYFDARDDLKAKSNQGHYLVNFCRFLKERFPEKKLTAEFFEELDHDSIGKFVFEGYPKKVSHRTCYNRLIALKSLYYYFTVGSYDDGTEKPLFYRNVIEEYLFLNKNAIDHIRKDISAARTKGYSRFLTKEDFLDILHYADFMMLADINNKVEYKNYKRYKNRTVAILALMMGAGLSTDELINLTTHDIDLRVPQVTVTHDGKQFHRKIDRDVLEYLRPYMQWRRQWFVSPPDNPTLFFLNNGKPMSPNGVQHLLKQVNRHYNGKQVSSNFIRQSFAINMYKTTGSLTATQEYLGFGSSAMMTRIIATVDEEQKKNRL